MDNDEVGTSWVIYVKYPWNDLRKSPSYVGIFCLNGVCSYKAHLSHIFKPTIPGQIDTTMVDYTDISQTHKHIALSCAPSGNKINTLLHTFIMK